MNIQLPHLLPSATAARAGGSSFYFAMRILGREQRDAMFEIYSYCRAVDDIADCDAPRERRLKRLADWRQDVEQLYAGTVLPGCESLAGAIARFDLRKDDFLAIIDGMEMDARADIRAPSMEQLDLYCDRVACAVGRLSVRVFGMDEDDGRALAQHLGRALQLTNIMRDIDEDAANGRLYLPREALQEAGINTTEPTQVIAHRKLDVACNVLVSRARDHFTKAREIMTRSPRRTVRAARVMGEVYRQMLDDLASRGWATPRQRIHFNKPQLLWIALRHAII